jgi:hypothetical protein
MDAGSADGPGPRPDDAAAQPVAVLEELLAARPPLTWCTASAALSARPENGRGAIISVRYPVGTG